MKKIKRVRDTPKGKTEYRQILNEYFAELLRLNRKINKSDFNERFIESRLKKARTEMSRVLDNSNLPETAPFED